ncbi:hypothetical protein [Colwellia echini]|uniref:hypothetical protein n=1 Tax=Colwellia echini TaxID=1982103 RepID=UPI0014782BAC|nr:hypothetical protein [Colwellia echini]
MTEIVKKYYRLMSVIFQIDDSEFGGGYKKSAEALYLKGSDEIFKLIKVKCFLKT